MIEPELVETGDSYRIVRFPYFSTPYVHNGKCLLCAYTTGKVVTIQEVRLRLAEHMRGKDHHESAESGW